MRKAKRAHSLVTISTACAELCAVSQGVLLLLLLLPPKEASSCSLACSMRLLWPEDGLLPLLPLPELRLCCAFCSELLCCRAFSVCAAALRDAHMRQPRGEISERIDEKTGPVMHLTSQGICMQNMLCCELGMTLCNLRHQASSSKAMHKQPTGSQSCGCTRASHSSQPLCCRNCSC